MSNFFNKMLNKSFRQPKHDEQTFSIQPHPAKTNDPADLLGGTPGMGGGLRSNPAAQAHHVRDPYIPSQDIVQGLEQPATREQLRARSAELNK